MDCSTYALVQKSFNKIISFWR